MRKPTVLALVAMLSALLLALPVTAAPEAEVEQTVSGTLALPQPTKASGTNVSRINRSMIFVGSASQGVNTWYFDVDPDTIGAVFELTTGAADADLDIIFYVDPGSLTDAPAAAAEFIGTGGTGESGIVPPGATKAIIYTAAGAQVPFTYEASEIQPVLLGGDLDVSVLNGQKIRFVNDTATDGYVRGTTDEGQSFDSGVIAAGSDWVLDTSALGILFGPADVAYTAHTGSGTITLN